MASPRPPQPLPSPSAVDPRVWRACAGPASRIPPLGSRVCYFPEGHAEHAWYPPDLSAVLLGGGGGFFRCRVSGARFLANPRSDEVFSEIHLDSSPSASAAVPAEEEDPRGGGGMSWFVKILTLSDANCGGGFTIPRSCADHIFPPLDFTADPPVQTLSITDLHGAVWKFRHVYRGAPRRHLLTTGWSTFVDSKRLVSGDAIVFVKDQSSGRLFVGFRRALRLFELNFPFLSETDREDDERTISKLGFSRCVRGRIPSATVVDAARSADLGRPFEVLYYPKAGLPEFVVPEAEVDAAIRVPWKVGMTVKVSVEAEDSSTMQDVWGTVANIAERGAQSPWRMLQVTWDQPEVMKNRDLDKVSPWQVEVVSYTPGMRIQYPENPLLKKWRTLENPGPLSDEQNSTLNPEYNSRGILSSVVFQSPVHPAGMQGARQDLICFLPINGNVVAGSSSSINGTSQQAEIVHGEMNISNTSHSSSIHPSQEAMLNGGSVPSSTSAFSQPTGIQTVELFGQTIIIEQPPADGGAGGQ